MLNDWNTGKIKYCTQPPEDDRNIHIDATIVNHDVREFEINNFEEMETEVLNNFSAQIDDVMEYTSTGPVQMADDTDELSECKTQIIEDVKSETIEPPAKKGRGEPSLKKVDAAMLLEGKLHKL